MARSFKVGNSVLCEYVARGDRNKHTLVNAYSGDVLIPSVPARLQFGIYFEIFPFEKLDELEAICTIKLGRKEFARAGILFSNATPDKSMVVVLQSMEIGVDKPITLSVFVTADGYRNTKVLSKKISVGDVF